MPKITEVDYDPFASVSPAASATPKITEVDYDPFAPAKPKPTPQRGAIANFGVSATKAIEPASGILKTGAVLQTEAERLPLNVEKAEAERVLDAYKKADMGLPQSIFQYDRGGLPVPSEAAARQYRRSTPEQKLAAKEAETKRLLVAQEALNKVAPASERPLYKQGEKIRKAVDDFMPQTQEEKESISGNLGSVTGSLGKSLVAGALTGGVGAAAVGASDMSVQGYEDAKQFGADEQQALQSARMNSLLGITEAFPAEKILSMAGKVFGRATPETVAALEGAWKRYGKNAVKGATAEGFQEWLQTVGSNLIASDAVGYDPNRDAMEGALPAAGYGGAAGGAAAVLATALGGKRNRAPDATQENLPQDTAPVDQQSGSWQIDANNKLVFVPDMPKIDLPESPLPVGDYGGVMVLPPPSGDAQLRAELENLGYSPKEILQKMAARENAPPKQRGKQPSASDGVVQLPDLDELEFQKLQYAERARVLPAPQASGVMGVNSQGQARDLSQAEVGRAQSIAQNYREQLRGLGYTDNEIDARISALPNQTVLPPEQPLPAPRAPISGLLEDQPISLQARPVTPPDNTIYAGDQSGRPTAERAVQDVQDRASRQLESPRSSGVMEAGAQGVRAEPLSESELYQRQQDGNKQPKRNAPRNTTEQSPEAAMAALERVYDTLPENASERQTIRDAMNVLSQQVIRDAQDNTVRTKKQPTNGPTEGEVRIAALEREYDSLPTQSPRRADIRQEMDTIADEVIELANGTQLNAQNIRGKKVIKNGEGYSVVEQDGNNENPYYRVTPHFGVTPEAALVSQERDESIRKEIKAQKDAGYISPSNPYTVLDKVSESQIDQIGKALKARARKKGESKGEYLERVITPRPSSEWNKAWDDVVNPSFAKTNTQQTTQTTAAPATVSEMETADTVRVPKKDLTTKVLPKQRRYLKENFDRSDNGTEWLYTRKMNPKDPSEVVVNDSPLYDQLKRLEREYSLSPSSALTDSMAAVRKGIANTRYKNISLENLREALAFLDSRKAADYHYRVGRESLVDKLSLYDFNNVDRVLKASKDAIEFNGGGIRDWSIDGLDTKNKITLSKKRFADDLYPRQVDYLKSRFERIESGDNWVFTRTASATPQDNDTDTQAQRGTVDGSYKAGDVVLTNTGRKTTPFPRIDFETNQKASLSEKRMQAWVIDNARAEAISRGDTFNALRFTDSVKKNPSPSDIEGATDYIFGDYIPPIDRTVKPITKDTASFSTQGTQKNSQTVAQTSPDNIPQGAVGKVRAVKPKRKMPYRRKSLLEFIASKGGVADDRGDLRSMGAEDWHRKAPFRRKLLRDTGGNTKNFLGNDYNNSLDTLALDAWDAGYFPEFTSRPSINDLLDAMDQELRGKPIYRIDDRDLEKDTRDYEGENENYLYNRYGQIPEGAFSDVEEYYASQLKELGLYQDDMAIEDMVYLLAERTSIADADQEADNAEAVTESFIDDYNVPDSWWSGGLNERQAGTEPNAVDTDAEDDSQWQANVRAERRASQGDQDARGGGTATTQGTQSQTVEKTSAGDQYVIAGAEKASDKKVAERRADQPLRANKPQRQADADGGLFDVNSRKQQDMFEGKAAPAGKGDTKFSRADTTRNTDTPAFKKWFSGSKVVDANGDPLVVYHGTKADFEEFERSRGGEFGSGMYFSDFEPSARAFGSYQSGTGPVKVVAAYLSLKNPLITNDRNIPRGAGVKKLIQQGYDGVIGTQPNGDKQYIAFFPEQIKSVNNRGTFDPEDARILYNRNSDAAAALPEYQFGGAYYNEVSQWTDVKKQIASKLNDIWKDTFGETRALKVVDLLTDSEGVEVEGFVARGKNPLNSFAMISLSDPASATGTLYHEGVHYLRNIGAFTDREWAILTKKARDKWRKQFNIDKRYAADTERWGDRAEEYLNEEAIAEALRHTMMGKPDSLPLIRRIATFFRKLKAVLGRAGFNTPDTIMARVGEGDYRAGKKDTDTITRTSSERSGAPVFSRAPATDSDAFRKWFDGSKVVDKDGKPLVVYHGTDAKFDAFDSMKSADTLLWFSSDKERIQNGEAGASGRENIIPVYISAKKLAGWDEYESLTIDQLIAEGYDGIKLDDDYVVFSPTQIKSVNNRGTFDSNDPRIMYSRPNLETVDVNDDGTFKHVVTQKVRASNAAIKKFTKRNLTKEGLLNDATFALKTEKESTFNAEEYEFGYLANDLVKATKKAYGKPYQNITAAQKSAMNDYLAGKKDAPVLAGVKPQLDVMRAYLDRLSDDMLKTITDSVNLAMEDMTPATRKKVGDFLNANPENADAGDLPESIIPKLVMMDTIARNKGAYLTRSYQAFDDADWKDKALANKDLMRRAEAFIAEQNPDLKPEEVRGAVRAILQSAKDNGNFVSFMSKGSKLGSKDVTLLKRRKDVPPVIRELLGEYQEPHVNFMRSANKMAGYVANHNFLMSVRKTGIENGFLFNKPTGENDTQVAAEGSDTMSPLNGLYATEDFVQGMKDAMGGEQVNDVVAFFRRASGMLNYGKVVLNPSSQVRNFVGNTLIAVANGHFDVRPMAKSLKVIASNEQKWRDYTKKLTRLGVLNDGSMAGELRASIRDATGGDGYIAPGKQKLRSIGDVFTKAYRAGDDFWKVSGFENEKALLIKHYRMSESDAEVEAAKRIRDIYPTYSNVPRAVNALRRSAVLGNFVSWPWEQMRTWKNRIALTVKDTKQSPALGAKRVAGMVVSASFAEMLAEYTMQVFGLDDEDDDAVHKMAPEWQRNATLVYLGYDDDGLPMYWDASYTDPNAYLKKPIRALIDGDVTGALKEAALPFVGLDLGTQGVLDLIYNKDLETGRPLYNPENPAPGIAKHLANTGAPGIVTNLMRGYMALNDEVSRSGKQYTVRDELLGAIGFRTATLNVPQSLIYQTYGFMERLRNASSELSYTAGSMGTVDNDDIKDAFSAMTDARKDAYSDLQEMIGGARKLGMNDDGIFNSLNIGGMSKRDAGALLDGEIPEWNPSAQFLRKAEDRALLSAPTEEKKKKAQEEFDKRIDLIYDLVDEQEKEIPLSSLEKDADKLAMNPQMRTLMRLSAPAKGKLLEKYQQVLQG